MRRSSRPGGPAYEWLAPTSFAYISRIDNRAMVVCSILADEVQLNDLEARKWGFSRGVSPVTLEPVLDPTLSLPLSYARGRPTLDRACTRAAVHHWCVCLDLDSWDETCLCEHIGATQIAMVLSIQRPPPVTLKDFANRSVHVDISTAKLASTAPLAAGGFRAQELARARMKGLEKRLDFTYALVTHSVRANRTLRPIEQENSDDSAPLNDCHSLRNWCCGRVRTNARAPLGWEYRPTGLERKRYLSVQGRPTGILMQRRQIFAHLAISKNATVIHS